MIQPVATPTELILPSTMTVEAWQKYGKYLKNCSSALSLWRADWLAYGRRSFKPEEVQEGLAQLELDLPGIARIEAIGSVPADLRHEGLTDAHYLAAAKRCANDQERSEWLNIAAKEKLSPRELQASIRAKTITRCDALERKVSVPSPYAVLREYKAWREAIGESWQTWSAEERKEVAATLLGPASFWRELQEN